MSKRYGSGDEEEHLDEPVNRNFKVIPDAEKVMKEWAKKLAKSSTDANLIESIWPVIVVKPVNYKIDQKYSRTDYLLTIQIGFPESVPKHIVEKVLVDISKDKEFVAYFLDTKEDGIKMDELDDFGEFNTNLLKKSPHLTNEINPYIPLFSTDPSVRIPLVNAIYLALNENKVKTVYVKDLNSIHNYLTLSSNYIVQGVRKATNGNQTVDFSLVTKASKEWKNVLNMYRDVKKVSK